MPFGFRQFLSACSQAAAATSDESTLPKNAFPEAAIKLRGRTIVITEGVSQSGMAFATNVLKFYYSTQGFSYLNLNLPAAQRCIETGKLNPYQPLEAHDFTRDKIVSMGSFIRGHYPSLLRCPETLVVEPANLHDSFLRYAICMSTGIWTRQSTLPPMDLATGSILVSRETFDRFQRRYHASRNLVARSGRVITVDNRGGTFRSTAESVFAQLGITDAHEFLNRNDVPKFVFEEIRYARNPLDYLANKGQVSKWLRTLPVACT